MKHPGFPFASSPYVVVERAGILPRAAASAAEGNSPGSLTLEPLVRTVDLIDDTRRVRGCELFRPVSAPWPVSARAVNQTGARPLMIRGGPPSLHTARPRPRP